MLIVLAVGLFTKAPAQWEPTDGPLGGDILSMAHVGPDIYAGTYTHGIYHSANNGDVWASMNNGLPSGTTVSAIAHTDAGLTIGTYAGVYRRGTLDTSWSPLPIGTGMPLISALVARGTKLFAAANGQMFRSLDDGANWETIVNGLVSMNCSDCPEPLYFSTACLLIKDTVLFLGTEDGIYRTINNGDDWYAVNQGLGGSSPWIVAALATNGNVLFAGINGLVYRSYDNGNHWAEVPSAWPTSNILALAASGTELFVSLWNNGIYRSIDDGADWSEFNTGLLNKVANTMEPSPPLLFCGTLNGGVFRTEGDIPDWEMVNEGLVRNGVRTMSVAGTDLLAGSWGTGVQTLGPDGLAWSPSNAGLTDGFISSLSELGDAVFVGTSNGLFQRANAISPWTLADQGLPGVVNTTASQGDVLLAGTGNGIFRSTDGGQNWEPAGNGASLLHVKDILALDTVIYAASFNGVHRSPDAGLNWTPMNTGLGSLDVLSLGLEGGALLAGTWNGIYHFLPITQEWEQANTGSPSLDCYAFAGFDSSIFAGTAVGVLVSNDNGLNWVAANQGLVDTAVASLAVHGEYLYAGLWAGGVWRRQLSQMTTAVETLPRPSTSFLLQGHPNPFNSTTVLSYNLPKASIVSLKVYNALSVEVASWAVNGAAGPHEIIWDAASLPSGTYFCRIQAADRSRTLRLLMVK